MKYWSIQKISDTWIECAGLIWCLTVTLFFIVLCIINTLVQKVGVFYLSACNRCIFALTLLIIAYGSVLNKSRLLCDWKQPNQWLVRQ